MRPSPILLRRARRAAMVLLLACPAAGADFPEGTLAVVAAQSLGDFDAAAARLLEPWRLKFNGLTPLLQRLVPQLELADRPLALGIGRFDGLAAPFALIPTDAPEELIDALNIRRRRRDPVVLAQIAGYRLSLQEIDGGVFAKVIRGGAVRMQPVDISFDAITDELGSGGCSVTITDRGFDEAAMWASRLGFVRGRVDLRRVRSLRDLLVMLPRLGKYAPLLRSLAAETEGATLRLSADPEATALGATLEVSFAKPNAVGPIDGEDQATPTLDALVGDRTPIMTLTCDRPLPAPLVRIALGWAQSRPDDIDADRYDPRAFAAYAESAAELLEATTHLRLAWITPEGEEPLATNSIEVARVREGTDVVDLIGEATQAMNRAIRRSRARTPLLASIEEIDTPEGPGIRTTTDVLKVLGGDGLEGVREVVERYYGPDGRHFVDVTPLGDDAWFRSSLPDAATAAVRSRLREAPATTAKEPIELRLWIDRWLAWKQRIDNVGKEDDLGRKARPPMAAAPPLRLRLSAEEDRLRCEATLPKETYEALAAYWIAEKVVAP